MIYKAIHCFLLLLLEDEMSLALLFHLCTMHLLCRTIRLCLLFAMLRSGTQMTYFFLPMFPI
jgi:hypothetical protein